MNQVGISSSLSSFTQFLTVILVFLLVLALTYFTTRFVGTFQKNATFNRNFEAIETYRISNGKYLQLVRVGEKYIVIGIAKDNITSICEVSEDEIVFKDDNNSSTTIESFKSLMDKATQRVKKGGNKNEK